MNANAQLIAEIEAYAKAVGMAESTICKKAGGNAYLLDRMRRGGSVTLTVAERVRAYIVANPPRRERRRAA